MLQGVKKEKVKINDLELKDQVVEIRRVVKVIPGGRRLNFRAIVIVGDQKKYVGYGVGKGNSPRTAVEKALSKARKSIFSVFLTKGTIPHTIEGKYNASRVIMHPGREGTGVVAGGSIRPFLECMGVRNISAKMIGRANNRLNVLRAAINAIQKIRSPKEIAEDRGISVERILGKKAAS